MLAYFLNKPLIGAFFMWRREGENTRGFDKFAWSKFARATKFTRSKFERAMRGPKGELQDVIRNGARRARRRDAPSNPGHQPGTGFPAVARMMV